MINLSNRQHPMLKIFAQNGTNWYMPVVDAARYDQRPLRSMLIRGWVAYRPGKGFHATRAGVEAWEQFGHTSITRKNVYAPLTTWLDPSLYRMPTRAELQEPQKRSTAA